MQDFNLIPMGDNCIIAETLKALNLRKCSYPFDWVSHKKYYSATNVMYNFSILDKLMSNTFDLQRDYLGFGEKVHNNIWFPHDDEPCFADRVDKYNRRFARLQTNVATSRNIFIFLTRHYVIPEPEFVKIVTQVTKYNPDNKIIYICGSPHPYLHKPKYRKSVAFQYLHYDLTKVTSDMTYDTQYYRPLVKQYLNNLFASIGIMKTV